MKYLLTHIQDFLTTAPAISGGEWLLLLVLLFCATIILNGVTNASDYSRMTGNFISLSAGALLSCYYFPDWAPPLAANAQFVIALFSGMTTAALVNIAILKPA